MPDSQRNELIVYENPYQIPDCTKNKLIVYENMYNISDSHKNQLKKKESTNCTQNIENRI